MAYKLCPECDQPILREGQRREHPDDYRHAQGCPLDDRDMDLTEERDALLSMVRHFRNGESPARSGTEWRWYGLDEDGCPKYRGALLSAHETMLWERFEAEELAATMAAVTESQASSQSPKKPRKGKE